MIVGWGQILFCGHFVIEGCGEAVFYGHFVMEGIGQDVMWTLCSLWKIRGTTPPHLNVTFQHQSLGIIVVRFWLPWLPSTHDNSKTRLK